MKRIKLKGYKKDTRLVVDIDHKEEILSELHTCGLKE